MNWLATILIILGYVLVIYKLRLGFIVQSIGCIIYVCLYFGVDYAVVTTNAVFFLINVLGYIKWGSVSNTG